MVRKMDGFVSCRRASTRDNLVLNLALFFGIRDAKPTGRQSSEHSIDKWLEGDRDGSSVAGCQQLFQRPCCLRLGNPKRLFLADLAYQSVDLRTPHVLFAEV